jgi:ferritin-like metal-binding protein YciE
MKFFSASLEDLRELYQTTLQKTLDMEQQITDALPTMIEKATDPQLKQALQTHLQETQTHVSRVEQIVTAIYGDAKTSKCKVASALISSAESLVGDTPDPAVCDAALIASAQQVEHHEIAIYGTLRTWAEILGEGNNAETFDKILDEEKNADSILTSVSTHVNLSAEAGAASRAA